MVQRRSPRRERLLRQLGRNVTLWRTIDSISASELAERAAITRATLRGIEHGTGTASSDALMATSIALGVADDVVDDAARAILRRVAQAVDRWEAVAADLGLPISQIHAMRPAFDEEQRAVARS